MSLAALVVICVANKETEHQNTYFPYSNFILLGLGHVESRRVQRLDGVWLIGWGFTVQIWNVALQLIGSCRVGRRISAEGSHVRHASHANIDIAEGNYWDYMG